MKTDQSQKTKLIILCCLLGAFVVLGTLRVIGMRTHAGSENEKQPQVVAREKQVAREPAAEEQTVVELPVVVSSEDHAKRDPFEPQIVATPTSPEPPSQDRRPPTPLIVQESGFPLPVASPLYAQPFGVDSHNEPVEDPTREFRLTGVVEGDIRVAIIRGPENKRYIVREGQSIDGKITVETITQTGVRLRHQGGTTVLSLGQSSST